MSAASNELLEFGGEFPLPWLMNIGERFALAGLLQWLKPRLSLEIGTHQGGSLQALSKFSEHVISIDRNPEVSRELEARFPNVFFRCGDSAKLLPVIVDETNRSDAVLDFVLIDGDHTTAGVRRDIEALLKLVPRARCVILMHDSGNPDCRAGIKSAPWSACPYVHDMQLDFVPGPGFNQWGQWGGFACALLRPEKRTLPLFVL
jgi:cephalosporin hydroxylase